MIEQHLPVPTAGPTKRCLDGIMILLVDDSRSVSEAIRIMSVRSGARLRRADSLKSARRHLMIYRPDIVIVDLSLPDGSGTELVEELLAQDAGDGPATMIISASEEEETRAAARDCGADGYIVKPITSFAQFQTQILSTIPEEFRADVDGVGQVTPDQIGIDAVLHDLENAADLFREARTEKNSDTLLFAAQFLAGVAGTVLDAGLSEGAERVLDRLTTGGDAFTDVDQALAVIEDRMTAGWAKAS